MRRRWIVGVPTVLLVAGVVGGVLVQGARASPVARTVTVARQASALVVDAATNRVFVAATGSNSVSASPGRR